MVLQENVYMNGGLQKYLYPLINKKKNLVKKLSYWDFI